MQCEGIIFKVILPLPSQAIPTQATGSGYEVSLLSTLQAETSYVPSSQSISKRKSRMFVAQVQFKILTYINSQGLNLPL